MSGQIVEERIIEISIENSQVKAGIEQMQNDLAQLNSAFERMGQASAASFSIVESSLVTARSGFSSLTEQVNAYIATLERANTLGANFRAPNIGAPNMPPAAARAGVEVTTGAPTLFDTQTSNLDSLIRKLEKLAETRRANVSAAAQSFAQSQTPPGNALDAELAYQQRIDQMIQDMQSRRASQRTQWAREGLPPPWDAGPVPMLPREGNWLRTPQAPDFYATLPQQPALGEFYERSIGSRIMYTELGANWDDLAEKQSKLAASLEHEAAQFNSVKQVLDAYNRGLLTTAEKEAELTKLQDGLTQSAKKTGEGFQNVLGQSFALIGLAMAFQTIGREIETVTGEKLPPFVKGIGESLRLSSDLGMAGAMFAPMLGVSGAAGLVAGAGIGAGLGVLTMLASVPEDVQKLNDALDQLNRKNKVLVTLSEVMGMNTDQSAEVLRLAGSYSALADALDKVARQREQPSELAKFFQIRAQPEGEPFNWWEQTSVEEILDFSKPLTTGELEQRYLADKQFKEQEYATQLANAQFLDQYAKLTSTTKSSAQGSAAQQFSNLTGVGVETAEVFLKLAQSDKAFADQLQAHTVRMIAYAGSIEQAKRSGQDATAAYAGLAQELDQVYAAAQKVSDNDRGTDRSFAMLQRATPSLSVQDMSSVQINNLIAQGLPLLEQYRSKLIAANAPVKDLNLAWSGIQGVILTADGRLETFTGKELQALQVAQQMQRTMQQWQAPSFQIQADVTPDKYAKETQVADRLAAQYIQGIRSSNIPLDQQNQILEQLKQKWATQVEFIRLADGSIKIATGSTAAFLGMAGQLVSAWERAAQQIAKAASIRPNIQTMPELNAGYAAQLQQYLVQYENLLRSMNVAQTPQQYMIFGQNGYMAQFITSAEAMQLAMALLQEQIGFNTAATEDATEASKINSDALRGSYNLPTAWGYKPPTPWEYYDDAKRHNRKVDMGPVNYPWLFDDGAGGGGGGSGALANFLKQPHLGLVPGGAGNLFETTFGKEIKPELDPALLLANNDATTLNTTAIQENTRALLDKTRLKNRDDVEESAFTIPDKTRLKNSIGEMDGYKGVGLFGAAQIVVDQFHLSFSELEKFRVPTGTQTLTQPQSQILPYGGAPGLSPYTQAQFLDPLRGKENYISQLFGNNPQRYGKYGLPGHEGIDFSAPYGTPVYPVAPGTIESVGTNKDYGNYVYEKLASGAEVLYAHLAKLPELKAGQRVDLNTILGLVGSTGNSTGPHLHLGYRPGGQYDPNAPYKGWQDPAKLLGIGAGGGESSPLETGIPRIVTLSQSISTNTANLLQRVPDGLTNVSSNIINSNALLAQILVYLRQISVNMLRPPTITLNVDGSVGAETEPLKHLGNTGIGLAGGAL